MCEFSPSQQSHLVISLTAAQRRFNIHPLLSKFLMTDFENEFLWSLTENRVELNVDEYISNGLVGIDNAIR